MSRIAGHLIRSGAAEADLDALLDFTGMTLQSGQNAIRGTSLDCADVTGWLVFQGDMTGSDVFRYASYFQPETDGTAKILGHGMTILLNSGADVAIAEDAQFHILVYSGATVADRAGDLTGGIHNIWAKVYGEVGATWESGCRVAPYWSDIQINGVDVSAEEVFHFFGSAGGSRARAFLYMEGQQSVYFFESDSDLGEAMLASSGYDTTQSNDPDGFLKVNLNGTIYGIPLMGAS